MSYPTPRRYPRSLAQAFPNEHANPIEFYPAPFYRRAAHVLRWTVLIASSICIGAVLARGS